MTILAIETSCDDTSISVLRDREILWEETLSQYKKFKKFKGVIPEISSREHVTGIWNLVNRLRRENVFDAIDYVAFTIGPGLINTLQVGLIAAKTISLYLNVPLIPINHLEAHLYSYTIGKEINFKSINEKKLGIIVSGGHTQLIEIKSFLNYKIIGETKDDTIGETYDKVGSLVGIDYPAGKSIDRMFSKGKNSYENVLTVSKLDRYNLSYSGLKSQIRRIVESNNYNKYDLLHSFQKAAISQLIYQVKKYLENNDVKEIIIGGGVSANSLLRKEINKLGVNYHFPLIKYSQDNGAMIANLAYLKLKYSKIKLGEKKSQLLLDSFSKVK